MDALLVRFQAPGGRDVLVVPCPPDLRFSKDWPGGHKDMSCTVVLPAGSPAPAALAKMARVSVTDRRTGRVVWAGRLTDPGMSTAPDGPVTFSVTTEGHQAEADGWREVYAVIDRAQESWQAVGEFSPAQGSFSGDLTPGLDFELDPVDFGDLVDFGDDLAIDFDGSLDFGGDLGGFGNIDFGGVDYPSNADYPGYLGYLQDPDGAFGDMLPIPLGGPVSDGSWWANWEPGYTDTGATATGTTVGTLTVAATGGTISRHRKGSAGVTVPPGAGVYATGRLGSSSTVLRLWDWADSSLLYSGYYLDITTTALTLFVKNGSTTVQVAVAGVALTAGTTYRFSLRTFPTSPEPGAMQRLVTKVHDVVAGVDVAGFTVDDPEVASLKFAGPTYWGVAGVGAAGSTVEFDTVEYLNED